MGRPSRYSPEVRERAVRLVLEHEGQYDSEWSAMRSIAEKIRCNPEFQEAPAVSDSVSPTGAKAATCCET